MNEPGTPEANALVSHAMYMFFYQEAVLSRLCISSMVIPFNLSPDTTEISNLIPQSPT